MQSQPKVKKYFRNWQCLLIKGGETSLKRNESIKRRVRHCFQNWQGIYYKNRKACFKNWQGIDLSSMKFDQEFVKNYLGAEVIQVSPPTSQIELDLRRCYLNWQGIYLDYMDFNQVISNINNTRSVLTSFDSISSDSFDSTVLEFDNIEPHFDSAGSNNVVPNLDRVEPRAELVLQTLEPSFDSSEPNAELVFETLKPSFHTPKLKPNNNSLIIEKPNEIQKDTIITVKKKKRYTSDFSNTKIPITNSFSTPIPSNELIKISKEEKEFIINYIDKNPTTVLNEAFESFINEGYIIKKSIFQNYIKQECNIKVLNDKIIKDNKFNMQRRKDWVHAWSRTNIDYTKNCLFIECSKLNVVMKSGGLPTKRPELKINPRYFFVAISTFGLIETQLFQPSVKREDPYVEFINYILNQLDKLKKNNCFIVLNNIHDWLLDDLDEIITERGYNCVYLPPFSNELNPINEFWRIVKYGIRRQYLYEGETISDRINESRHDNISKEKLNEIILSSKLYFNKLSKKL